MLKNKNTFFIGILVISSILFSANSTTTLDNITKNISYGDCVNISMNDSWKMVCAPNFPTIIKNLTGSESGDVSSYYYNTTDSGVIDIKCFNQKLNDTRNLTFSGTTNITQTNTIVICPNFPTMNLRSNLSSGGSMTSWDNRYLYMGNLYDYGYLISCLSETTNSDLQNQTNICNANLLTCQSLRDTYIGTSSACQTNLNTCQADTGNKQTIINQYTNNENTLNNTIKNLREELSTKSICPIDITSINITSIISSCKSPLQIVCPTAFGDYCDTQEILDGSYDKCIQRIKNSSETNYKTCDINLQQKTYEAQQCKTGNQGFTDSMILFIEAISVVFIMCALSFLLWEFVLKKNNKEN